MTDNDDTYITDTINLNLLNAAVNSVTIISSDSLRKTSVKKIIMWINIKKNQLMKYQIKIKRIQTDSHSKNHIR